VASLELVGVRKRFHAADIIRGVDLAVRDGEFMVFVGPSGCGKSTMLRMIAGLEELTEGDIRLAGQSIVHQHPADRGVAMVFQSYALYPSMTVEDNIGFALKVAGVSSASRRQRVLEVAQMLELEPLLQRLPKQLSGGQRQRVAIGRALVRQPRLFLFDEPLSNLDAELRTRTRVELAALHRRLGTTMVYVTHDQVEAMTLGDRIAVFNEGCIEQVGPPMELYNRPATEFVAGFIGSPRINLLEVAPLRQWVAQGARANTGHGAASVRTWVMSWPAAARRVGIRPDRLRLASPGAGIPARVVHVEHLGDNSILHVQLTLGTPGADSTVQMKVPGGEVRAAPGDEVHLTVDRADTVLAFDENGRRIEG
jgi:multiple sugar transport system ATP-binding protein